MEIFKRTAGKFLRTLPLLMLPQSGIPDVLSRESGNSMSVNVTTLFSGPNLKARANA